MKCNNTKHTCGPKYFAVCIEYQGVPPEFSSLTEGCLDVEEVINDIYEILINLRTRIVAQDEIIAAQQLQITALQPNEWKIAQQE